MPNEHINEGPAVMGSESSSSERNTEHLLDQASDALTSDSSEQAQHFGTDTEGLTDQTVTTTPTSFTGQNPSASSADTPVSTSPDNLPVDPPKIVSLLPCPLLMTIGTTGKLCITIAPKQLADTEVAITVDKPEIVQVPASVIIKAGQLEETLTMSNRGLGCATVLASLNGITKHACIQVHPSGSRVQSIKIVSASLLKAFCVLLAFFLVLYGILIFSGSQVTLPLVLLFGALGSFIAQQRRLKEFSDEDLQLLMDSKIYMWLSPVTGAILAGILYLIFIGDMLGGDLFPWFDVDRDTTRQNGIKVIFEIGSKEPSIYGKLLFWSFVAGYSERFVTDIIGRFESQANTRTDQNTHTH